MHSPVCHQSGPNKRNQYGSPHSFLVCEPQSFSCLHGCPHCRLCDQAWLLSGLSSFLLGLLFSSLAFEASSRSKNHILLRHLSLSAKLCLLPHTSPCWFLLLTQAGSGESLSEKWLLWCLFCSSSHFPMQHSWVSSVMSKCSVWDHPTDTAELAKE